MKTYPEPPCFLFRLSYNDPVCSLFFRVMFLLELPSFLTIVSCISLATLRLDKFLPLVLDDEEVEDDNTHSTLSSTKVQLVKELLNELKKNNVENDNII